MQLIIYIDEETYKKCKWKNNGVVGLEWWERAIANGTPLEEELEKIRAEIKEKIEQEEFARSVFRHEEKDTVKAEQCTGSIMAYKNVIILFDKYKAESEEPKGENK